jgi:hypothetical protein
VSLSPPSYLFEADRLIGTVSSLGPEEAQINLPMAAADEPQLRHGERVGAGEVGESVIIEAGDIGIFARISEVRLPERDRLAVQPMTGGARKPNPIGTAQMLCSVPVSGSGPERGIARYPRVGARVYSLHPQTIAWIAEHAGAEQASQSLRLKLANLPDSATTAVRVTPERLFGRHCAVLGATGGGKSWTLARIVESCAAFEAKAKVLLLDATGEYHRLTNGVTHVSIGSRDRPQGCKMVGLPYDSLDIDDLFALFRPAGQVQAPKLRDAMKSLKLAALEDGGNFIEDGLVPKADRPKAPIDEAYSKHAAAVDAPAAGFNIKLLPAQLAHECVYSSAFGQARGVKDHTKFGGEDPQAFSACSSLIGRIESYLAASEFAPILDPGDVSSVLAEILSWLEDPDSSVLRVSLKGLSFRANIREIIANGIARFLLEQARNDVFAEHPLLVCLDEAHQFLDKSIGDEYARYPLDAFDLLAKEGRKYSLSLCLATQRPRDVPDSVLGQMGTMLVHRLSNDSDRRVVERAAGDIDRSAAQFVPSLAPGQAVLLGIDYPIPLVIQITPPEAEPDSRGPDYQRLWSKPAEGEAVQDTDPAQSPPDVVSTKPAEPAAQE